MSDTITLAGQRYRIVEQGVVRVTPLKGRPYAYNAVRIQAVKEKGKKRGAQD